MAECTERDLRKARESAGYTQWRLAEALSVSEDTIKRWEAGRGLPQPDDVNRLAKLVGDPTLWHRWMISNCDSYREHYMQVPVVDIPAAVLGVRIAVEDLMTIQSMIERDAADGQIDNATLASRYGQALDEAIAHLNAARQKL